MSLEDKDFIMRQIKTLAEGLGALLDKKSIKALITYDQAEGEKLSDDELEAMLLVIDVEKKAKLADMSEEQLAQSLGVPPERWRALSAGKGLPTAEEETAMNEFLG